MIAAMIEGVTRVCGKAQGYLGLPVRDELDGTWPCMVTAWTPSPVELVAINAGASVHVLILGVTPPPIRVEVGPVPE